MALSSSVVWEVETGGSDSNGGGFDSSVTSPGTDHSQQSAAQVAFNGSTIAATTAGIGATITITGYTVLATDNGNVIQITGGTNFTAGFYTITSVSTGSNTWTLDRNCTTGAGSAMTGNMGGALLTIAKPFTPAVGGNTIWVKGGTYTITSAIIPTSSTNLYGYGTTRGDGVKATITTATNSVHIFDFNNKNYIKLKWFKLTNTAVTPGNGITCNSSPAYAILIANCEIAGTFAVGINSNNTSNGYLYISSILNCEIHGCTGFGMSIEGGLYVHACYVHDNGGGGIQISTLASNVRVLVLNQCIIYNNTGVGIGQSGNINNVLEVIIFSCNIVDNTSDGIAANANGVSATIEYHLMNNIVYGNGGFGSNIGSSNPTLNLIYFNDYNAYGSNTSGAYHGTIAAGAHDVTLTANPFNSIPTDFSLNSTSGGGASCKGVGYSQTVP